MPGSYVPPHLRNKAASTTPNATSPARTGDRFSLEEIYEHFWEIGATDHTDGGRLYLSESLSRTLHGSKKTPDKLAFVFLFAGANPRWDTDRIIFTKSNLDLLPSEESGAHAQAGVGKLKEDVGGKAAPLTSSAENEEAGRPIAAFKQVGFGQRKDTFVFDGWYSIALVDFLEPKSPELVRMLEQKWTKNKGGRTIQEARSSESWQRSLALRWAVVKFARDEAAGRERGAPKIERKPERPRRSVNEMLAEMRVKDVTSQTPTEVPARSNSEYVVGPATAAASGDVDRKG